MAHQDGRCATTTETVYVQNVTGCVQNPQGTNGEGSASNPLCSMEHVALFLSSVKDLIVVRGTVTGASTAFAQTAVTLVGQQSALIGNTGVPAFAMAAGSFYIGSVTINAGGAPGIKATGGTITLDRVTVDGCPGGGILLDGAGFDLENTVVTRSGKATFNGLTTWGGILINNPPTSGPARLNLLTVQNNTGGGITCSTAITSAAGVLASNNTMGVDINDTCSFSSCQTASSTCGAQ
jgi:hypothetical protein